MGEMSVEAREGVLKALQLQMSQMQEQINQQGREIKKQDDEVKKISKLESLISKLKQQIDQLITTNNQLIEQRNKLIEERDELRIKVQELSQKEREFEQEKQKLIAEMKEKNRVLENKKRINLEEPTSKNQTEIKEKEPKIVELQKEINQKRDELETQKSINSQLGEALSKALSLKESEIRSKEEEITALQDELKKQQQTNDQLGLILSEKQDGLIAREEKALVSPSEESKSKLSMEQKVKAIIAQNGNASSPLRQTYAKLKFFTQGTQSVSDLQRIIGEKERLKRFIGECRENVIMYAQTLKELNEIKASLEQQCKNSDKAGRAEMDNASALLSNVIQTAAKLKKDIEKIAASGQIKQKGELLEVITLLKTQLADKLPDVVSESKEIPVFSCTTL